VFDEQSRRILVNTVFSDEGSFYHPVDGKKDDEGSKAQKDIEKEVVLMIFPDPVFGHT
jgi:hypothetical protein